MKNPFLSEDRGKRAGKRRLWIGGIAGTLLVTIVVALLVAPEFIDWNRYRDDVAAGIEQKLGRPVSIDGPLSLSLLPVPHLVAERVRVANIPGAADADFAAVGRIELRLHRLPLLSGRFEVSSLVLVKPEIHLERLANGRANWRLEPTADIHRHDGGKPPAVVFAAGTPGSIIERVEMRDARISMRLPRIGLVEAGGIDAQAQANGAAGPYQVSVHGRLGAAPLSIDGSLGEMDRDETPVDLAIAVGEGAARISVGGVLTGRDAATTLNGRLTVKAPHARTVAALLGLGSVPDGPVEIRSPLVATVNEVSAQGLSADLPGASLSGFAALNLEGDPQLDLKLATPRFDLASWLGNAGPDGKAVPASSAAPAPALASGLASVAGVAVVPPAWLGVSVDLSAESIVWHQGLIRGARLNALVANGEVTINQVGASLPGGTQVNLFGFIDRVAGKPTFDGSFESGADDLRSLLNWVHVDVGDVPGDRLGAARFTGHVIVNPDRLKLDGAELRVDGTRITTAVDLRLPTAAAPRPALGAAFAIDTLNADAYRPRHPVAAIPDTAAAPGTPTTPTTPAAAPLGLARWLAAFDANIRGRIERLVAGGVTAAGIDLDGALTDGTLTLRNLAIADVDGARTTLAGAIGNLDGTPRVQGLKLDLHADDPRRLLQAVGVTAPPDDLTGLALSAQLDGDVNALTVQGHAESGGLAATINGSVATVLTAPKIDLALDATHSSLAGALRLFGLDYRRPAGKQPVSGTVHLTGDTDTLALDDLHLRIGNASATGHATLALAQRPRLDATLTADEVPLDAFLGAAAAPAPAPAPAPAAPRPQPVAPGEPSAPQAVPQPKVDVGGIPDRFSRAPIDLDWMRAWDATLSLDAGALTWGSLRMPEASLALTLGDGKLAIDRFAAKLWDGALSGTAALDADGAVSASAQLANASLKQATLGVADLALADGTFDANATVTSSGHSLAELMGRLAGSGKIAAHDGVLKGFDLKAASDRLKTPGTASLVTLVEAGTKGGETHFSALTGTLKAAAGIVTTDDLTMTADGGTMTATGAINLPAYAVDSRAALQLAGAPQAPPLGMRIAGPLDNPRRVIDINPLQTWLAQRAKGQ